MDGTMWLHSLRTAYIKEKLKECGNIIRVISSKTFKAESEEYL